METQVLIRYNGNDSHDLNLMIRDEYFMKDKTPMLSFTVVYFVVFWFLIDLVFRNTLSVFTDLLAVTCLILALIISIGMADYTVKKLSRNA